MPVDIDQKDGEYGKKCFTTSNKSYRCEKKYIAKDEPYPDSDLFQKISHKLISDETQGSYVTFKSVPLRLTWENFNFLDDQKLEEVNIYFPKSGKTYTPLVIVIITNKHWCYQFSNIKNLKGRYDIKRAKSFPFSELLDNLISENNKLNSLITYRLDKKDNTNYDGVTVSEEKDHPSFDKYKHTPSGSLDAKTIYILYGGHKLILNKAGGYKGHDKLEDFDNKTICEFVVYFFKLSNNGSDRLPTYLEVIIKETTIDHQTKTYYLERSDHVGVRWKQISNPKLEDIITYLLDKKEPGSYNNSITVTNENNSSFFIYEHKPQSSFQDRKAYLFYNGQTLELKRNDSITKDRSLNDFNNHKYTEVALYYYKEISQNQVPIFLELKLKPEYGDTTSQQDCEKNGKCYLFKRVDDVGTKWIQIDYQNLRETVTYRLEWNDSGHKYNDANVSVTKLIENSLERYTHTFPEDHKQKESLLLYNWKIILLQKNDAFPGQMIDKLHGKNYFKLVTYFSQSNPEQPPFYFEVYENKSGQSSEYTGASYTTYCFQRVDPDGLHWTQIIKPNDLGPDKVTKIIKEINNDNKNSIMVRIDQTGPYELELIKNYRKDGIGDKNEEHINILVSKKILLNSSYHYYEHDFSKSKALGESANIESLRLFIKTTEIKIYDTNGIKQKLSYNVKADENKKVQIFIYLHDKLPLMLIWDKNPYTSNKNGYLTRWNQIRGLTVNNFTVENTRQQIKNLLDDTNKEFNEILLDQTKEPGYGISITGRLPPEGFDIKRVAVSVSPVQLGKQDFGKIIHKTANNSNTGKIKFDQEDLVDSNRTPMSKALASEAVFKLATVVSVTAYYHKTDLSFTKPLLLGFTKLGSKITDGQNPDLFYQSILSYSNINWKKIDNQDELRPLRQGNTGLEKRINSIHYNIGKSIIVRVDHQDQGGSGNKYPVQLVDNKGGGSVPKPAGDGKNIQISNDCTTKPPPTGYVCFKHQIPTNIGSTSHYISGLRLYACDKYLETKTSTSDRSSLPIHYNPGHREVRVYFYGGNSNRNPPLDKVPLLVQYEETYFKPSSRDGYFTNWVKADVRDENDGRGDSVVQGKTLDQVLDEVNKELNTIQLEKTGDDGNTSYGIKEPDSETENCPNHTSGEKFCNRVKVTRETGSDGSNYYKKISHKTVNQGHIGAFMFYNEKIYKIKTHDLKGVCNKVDVYYFNSDKDYSRPLLIHIVSENAESSQTCTGKWFHRIGIKPTDWNDAEDKDGQFSTDHNIKTQLDKIQIKLSNYLYLNIEKQKLYDAYVQQGSQIKKKVSTLNSSLDYGNSEYKPENYRFCKHQLYDYYSSNKEEIKIQLELGSHYNNLTLQVNIYLVSNLITFLGTTGDTLTYGPGDQAKADSNQFLVYFYEPETYGTGNTDWVPLLFKYGDKFFVPNSKKEYFQKWKQVNIDTGLGNIKNNIKTQLDEINEMLNEVDLFNKGSGINQHKYGLDKPDGDTDLGDFKTERIIVNKQENLGNGEKKYTRIFHTTVNGYNIGSIGGLGSSCTFDNQHTRELSNQKHNEAVVVYTGASTTSLGTQNPQLVLVAESKGKGSLDSGKSTVLGYYYLSNRCDGATPYKFKPVKTNFKLNDITNKDTVQDSCSELAQILERMGIVKEKAAQVQAASYDSVHGSGLQSNLGISQDERAKVGLGAGADGLGGSGSVDSGAKDGPGSEGHMGPAGPATKRGETGPQGLSA